MCTTNRHDAAVVLYVAQKLQLNPSGMENVTDHKIHVVIFENLAKKAWEYIFDQVVSFTLVVILCVFFS